MSGDRNEVLVGVELVPMFRRALELCGVKPGETVLTISDPPMNVAYPAAVMGAALEIGADAFQIVVPTGGEFFNSRSIVDAWKVADLTVVSLTSAGPWVYADSHNEVLDAGGRTLTVGEPADILRRMFPTDEIRRRTTAGQELMARGRKLRITSEAGTDLALDRGERPVLAQYGISDQPGRWDHWPSGQVVAAPLEDSANGTLVVDSGDILLALGRYVTSPVRCTFRDGLLVEIEGGADAKLLRDFLESAREETAFRVSHIGWGTDDRARWEVFGLRSWEGAIMDAESFYGNMMLALGTNNLRQLGGQSKGRFHIDLCTRGHSFWVDDALVLDHGRFVVPELI